MTDQLTSADRLFRSGVDAYKQGAPARARAAWIEALRENPRHADTWMALSSVCRTPGERLYCLLQLQRLRPDDPRVAQAIAAVRQQSPRARPERLPELTPARGQSPRDADASAALDDAVPQWMMAAEQAAGSGEVHPARKRSLSTTAPLRRSPILSRQEDERIKGLLLIAEKRIKQGDEGGALNMYVSILEKAPANPEALAGAVRLLSRQRRLEEARDLTERSIDAGNEDSGAYVSLAELRLYSGASDPWAPVVALRYLPDVRVAHFIRGAVLYWEQGYRKEALELLHFAEKRHPGEQAVLMKLAELYREAGYDDRAERYLHQVVDHDTRSELGQQAEETLLETRPYIPRQVQGSMLYALREVLGIFLFFFLLALLDGGLRLGGITGAGWGGIALSIAGGYLLVTATSSPAQRVLQPLLDEDEDSAPADESPHAAYLPEMAEETPLPKLPMDWRYLLGAVGGVMLVIALVLVLQNSLLGTGQTIQSLRQGRVPVYVDDLLTQWFTSF